MALLQTFPEFSVERIPVEQEMPDPVIEPMEVAFRRGGQLNNLINTIRGCNYVLVDAAPGAGKTSVLPVELAKQTGALVILVLPYEPLAYVTYLYLLRKNKGCGFPIEYTVDIFDSLPKTGLVITHAGWLAARWCNIGYAELPECYLLQDECHESGAASAFVREFAPYLSTVRSYVMMSATIGPANFRSMETGGNVLERHLEGDYYDTLGSLASSRVEWAPAQMRGHVIIFEDDLDRVRGVRLAYAKLGVKAYHWHAHIDPYEFASQYSGLFKSTDSPAVIIADSTFRSGYTLPVSVIVDSGMISRKVVVEGSEARMSRKVYACEKQQTKARGGRMDGQLTTYHLSADSLEKKMTTLEQVDVEALALLCKLIGCASRVDLSAAVMSGDSVPKEVSTALNGAVPLAAMPPESIISVAAYNALVSARAKSAPIDGSTSTVPITSGNASSDVSTDQSFSFEDLLSQYDTMFAQEECEYGRILACDVGLVRSPEVVRRSDVAAIIRHVARAVEGTAYRDEATYDEAASLLTLVDEYNTKMLTIAAFKLVAERIRQVGLQAKDGMLLRQYLLRMSRESTDTLNDSRSLFHIIRSSYFRKFRVRHDDGDYTEQIESIARRYCDAFDSIGDKASYSIESAMKAATAAIDEIVYDTSAPRRRFLSISN